MKRLLLLGGGHAHVQLLKALAREPLRAANILLVSPHEHAVYSGMVPGFVAGHYCLEQCQIALRPLAQAAGVAFQLGQASGLNPERRLVHLADGRQAEYDHLSVNTGGTMRRDRIQGAQDNAMFVRPMEQFVHQWPKLLALAREKPLNLAVVGAGAGGVELAMSLAWRLGVAERLEARVHLLSGTAPLLQGHAPGVRERVAAALKRLKVTLLPQQCSRIDPKELLLEDGLRLACDAPLIATGSEAPAWLVNSGLALDERGFIAIGPSMQSLSHPEVFAAGDVSSRVDVAHPRSGVYAVRAGPVLERNLRLAVGGLAPQPYTPPQHTLNLLACGDKRAIVSWGEVSAQGRWAWWWKDGIDRAFIRRFKV